MTDPVAIRFLVPAEPVVMRLLVPGEPGPAGAQGDLGPAGPQGVAGPPGTGAEDPGDLTLIFDNQLI